MNCEYCGGNKTCEFEIITNKLAIMFDRANGDEFIIKNGIIFLYYDNILTAKGESVGYANEIWTDDLEIIFYFHENSFSRWPPIDIFPIRDTLNWLTAPGEISNLRRIQIEKLAKHNIHIL